MAMFFSLILWGEGIVWCCISPSSYGERESYGDVFLPLPVGEGRGEGIRPHVISMPGGAPPGIMLLALQPRKRLTDFRFR
jgi:hypothetical protein